MHVFRLQKKIKNVDVIKPDEMKRFCERRGYNHQHTTLSPHHHERMFDYLQIKHNFSIICYKYSFEFVNIRSLISSHDLSGVSRRQAESEIRLLNIKTISQHIAKRTTVCTETFINILNRMNLSASVHTDSNLHKALCVLPRGSF